MATLISQETANNLAGLGDYANTEYRIDQPFILATGATITGFDVSVNAEQGTFSGDVTVRIETDNSGDPSGTLVDANAEIALDMTAGQYNTFTFPASFTIAASTKYHIRLNCSDQATSVRFLINTRNSGALPGGGGNMLYNTDGGSWIEATDGALTMHLYGSITSPSTPRSQSIIIV